MKWIIDGTLMDDDPIYVYDSSKIIRKVYDDYIIYEYDGTPFLKLKR